jgi:predicted PhzF superfamily epimerase YddE/YHI9
MKLPLYQVDAFTNRVFGGNPAAVVILDDWLPDDVLANIAAENNLAETAFAILRPDVVPLRWFTPAAVEVDLCGHATLAAAHVLFRYSFPEAKQIIFSTRSGNLTVVRDGELLNMDFPARPGKPVPISDSLVCALGGTPREAFVARDLMAVFGSEAEVRDLHPDFNRIVELDTFAVIATAPGDTVDFVSRFFAPRAGIPEDPATGSSHCTLAPYWASRLGKSELVAKQISARGGDLVCNLHGNRVSIAGRTAEYLRGEITLTD